MGEYRKPPAQGVSRPEPASLDDDSLPFSIETTTMRLKSLKLRRAEAAERELERAAGAQSRSDATQTHRIRPAGRVRHDERGQAVWDWAVASGEFATLSATNMLRKLDVGGLAIEQTSNSLKQPVREAGSDPYNQVRATPAARGAPHPAPGGGGDPYNQAGSMKPVTAANRPARPAPAPAPEKRPGNSVLDQLLGRRK